MRLFSSVTILHLMNDCRYPTMVIMMGQHMCNETPYTKEKKNPYELTADKNMRSREEGEHRQGIQHDKCSNENVSTATNSNESFKK